MARSKGSKARRAGVAAGVAARSWDFAKRVDWATVMVRARWLAHHSKRLYDNLTPAERKEFLSLVVPEREAAYFGPEQRERLKFLVTKALSGSASGTPPERR
jgi:hypothetical protein